MPSCTMSACRQLSNHCTQDHAKPGNLKCFQLVSTVLYKRASLPWTKLLCSWGTTANKLGGFPQLFFCH